MNFINFLMKRILILLMNLLFLIKYQNFKLLKILEKTKAFL